MISACQTSLALLTPHFAVLFLSTVAISPGDGMITSNCPTGAEERRGGEAISSALPRPELELW
jgi:hypothetical protein